MLCKAEEALRTQLINNPNEFIKIAMSDDKETNDLQRKRLQYFCFQEKPSERRNEALNLLRSYLDDRTYKFLSNYIAKLRHQRVGIFKDDARYNACFNYKFSAVIKGSGIDAVIAAAVGAVTGNPIVLVWLIDQFVQTGSTNLAILESMDSVVRRYITMVPRIGEQTSPNEEFLNEGKRFETSRCRSADDNRINDYESFVATELSLVPETKPDVQREVLFSGMLDTVSMFIPSKVKASSTSSSTSTSTSTSAEGNAMPKLELTDLQRNIIIAALGDKDPSRLNEMIERVNGYEELKNKELGLQQQVTELNSKIATLSAQQPAEVEVKQSSGDIPSGKTTNFPVVGKFPELKSLGINFSVPGYEWNGVHPHVPQEDPDYIFRPETLLPLLMAIASGENVWLSGHTGSGKTTLVEQVCSRLNYPLVRVAFDHAIDRYELMGSTSLIADGKGGTKSQFNPGILEQTIPNGYVLLCDELDCARPDSLYVMQDILEHKTKFVLESNDESGQKSREIKFNPMTRIIATGNTKGNGDQFNLYPACRTLSAATLDRFSTWIEIPYLTKVKEKSLLKNKILGLILDDAQLTSIVEFANCMRDRFINGTIPVSFSPRRAIAFAKKTNFLMSSNKNIDFATAARVALQSTVLAGTDSNEVDEILSLAQLSFSIDQSKGYERVVREIKA